jgi:hypothetical protein
MILSIYSIFFLFCGVALTAHAQSDLQTTKYRNMVIDLGDGLKTDARLNLPSIGDGAAIADQIQTMDVRDTLKYTKGVDVAAEMLDLHAGQLLDLPLEEHVEPMNQTNIR